MMQQLTLFDLIEEDEESIEEETAQEPRRCSLTCIAAGCIKNGLHSHPLIVDHPVDIRWRNQMLELAEALGWPRISYWSANEGHHLGPGRRTWHKYYTHGSDGFVADTVGALDRRQRGEPDRLQKRQQRNEEDEEC
jgi:hypothetical protein